MIRKLILKDVADKYPAQARAVAELIFTSMGYSWLAELLAVLVPIQLIVIGMIAVLTLVWPWPIIFSWHQVLAVVANPIVRVCAVILLLFSGLLLYLARTYMRPIYGLTEVCIGVATCWGGLSYANPSAKALTSSLAVFGGIYIIIRGFDNILDDKALTDFSRNRAEDAIEV